MTSTTFTQTTAASSGPYAGNYLWSDASNWTNGVPVDGSDVVSSLTGFADIAGLDIATLTIPSGAAQLDVVSDLTIGDVILGATGPGIVADAGFGSPVTLDVQAITFDNGVTNRAGNFGAEYPGAVLDVTVNPDPGSFYYVYAGATLEVHGTPSDSSTLAYESSVTPAGTIALYNPAAVFAGLLGNVGAGTVLELPGSVVNSLTIGSGGFSLSVTTDLGSYAFSQVTFGPAVTEYTSADDPNTGLVAITFETAPCYAEGTRILTIDGERPVETLRPGMLVATTAGFAPVRWVGRRGIDCRRHPRPEDVWPVRVRAGAFGEMRPHRDLLLSPDHAVYEDGVLIPVRYLLNGATIAQEAVANVSYRHVELPRHAVIFAEGLTAESFLDTGNRGDFVNAGAPPRAAPDDEAGAQPDPRAGSEARATAAMAVWESAAACADLVTAGPALHATKRRLLARAEVLGCATTADPGLRVEAGGCAVLPVRDGQVWTFDLPRGVRGVRLVSRSFVPAWLDPGSDDCRRLGVAVAALRADGVDIMPVEIRPVEIRPGSSGPETSGPAGNRPAGNGPAEGAHGWHAPEAGWRWTNGNAAIDCAGASRLEVTLVPIGRYWTGAAGADAARVAAAA